MRVTDLIKMANKYMLVQILLSIAMLAHLSNRSESVNRRGRFRGIGYEPVHVHSSLHRDPFEDYFTELNGFLKSPSSTKQHQLGSSYSVWNGKLVYFMGRREVNLADANEICGSMNGILPTIHSKADTEAIEKIMGHDARAWLGAKNHSMDSSQFFEWMDGSPWDYELFPTSDHKSPCLSHCCGIGYTTVAPYDQGFVVKNCADTRRMICVIDDIKAIMDQILPEDNEMQTTLQQHEGKIAFLTSFNLASADDMLFTMRIAKERLKTEAQDVQAAIVRLNDYANQVLLEHNTDSLFLDHMMTTETGRLLKFKNQLMIAFESFNRQLEHSFASPRVGNKGDRVDEIRDRVNRLSHLTELCFFLIIMIAIVIGAEVGYKSYASGLAATCSDIIKT